MFKKSLVIFSLLLTSLAAQAQVSPASRGSYSHLSVGGEFSAFLPDYNPAQRLKGIGIYADYDLTPKISAEAEARFMGVFNSEDGNESQKDYLIGPRYVPLRFHHISPYAKFMVGGVWITFPQTIGSGSYFAMVPGGGLDYQFSHRFSVRGEYEYQFLPSAPNIPNQPNQGLTPSGFSFGLAYRVF